MANLSRAAKTLFLSLLGMILAAIGVVIGWWLMQIFREEEEAEEAVRIPPQRSADINIPLPPQIIELIDSARNEDTAPSADDLTAIDGIGPKYADGLVALGITTYADLSAQEPDELADKLRSQGLRIVGKRIRTEDWVGQAKKLAGAAG
jgi:predicted flap endonuclease-1-like 5' DNA nuclease